MSELVGKRPVLREAVGAFPGQGLLAFCEAAASEVVEANPGLECEAAMCEAVEAIQGLEYEELGVHQGQLRRVRLDHRRVRRDRDLCRVRLDLFRVGEGRIPLHLCRLSRLSRLCPLSRLFPPRQVFLSLPLQGRNPQEHLLLQGQFP